MLPQRLRFPEIPFALRGKFAHLAMPMAAVVDQETKAGKELRSRPASRQEKHVPAAAPLGEPWHFLQFSDAIDRELACAMAEFSSTILWEPDRSFSPVRPGFKEAEHREAGGLTTRRFPILRGYARPSLAKVLQYGPALARRLEKHSPAPEHAPLVCTTPYLAAVAEHWPGPVVYWLTDRIAQYHGANPAHVRELDARMCRVATLVCPASHRLALYLREEAGCAPEKLQVLPNATRLASIPADPLTTPEPWPANDTARPAPVAGVLGNLADNMDWIFLEKLLERTPWLSWSFVGPTGRMTGNRAQVRAREAVRHHPGAHFWGAQPYRELFHFARSFSVAVLPYRFREPTYSGSSTRFYEHLAASHPILATPAVAELESKEPILTLVRTPGEAVQALEQLRENNFDDGLRLARWWASRENTWRVRAETMRSALRMRLASAAEKT